MKNKNTTRLVLNISENDFKTLQALATIDQTTVQKLHASLVADYMAGRKHELKRIAAAMNSLPPDIIL
jgi:hypothetical protein